MRAVTTRTAAVALDLTERRLANILSRYPVRSLQRGQRGQARRIPLQTVEYLAVTLEIEALLGIPLAAALKLADRTLENSGHLETPTAWLNVDLESIRHTVLSRLATAVEEVVPPRRGRPPSR